ncbi:MAG: extracellular solute-binding protein [Candidatus Bathyarchaeia archaeon]
MSEAPKKSEVTRRRFVKTAGAGILGLAVGAGLGYSAATSMAPAGGPAATVTVTGPSAASFPFNLPRKGGTVAERAINAAKYLLDQHPEWKGTELVLACVGGYEPGFNAMKGRWEQETGTKVVVSTTPLPSFFEKMMVEAVSRTGSIDLINAQTMYLSDLAEAELLYPLDDSAMWIDIRERGRPDGYIYPLDRTIPYYKGKLYGFLQDGDVQLLYYRKDYLTDPKEQEAFEKQYGYPLAPPKTMFEYRDICHFFTRPPDLYGSVEFRELTRNSFTWYLYVTAKKWPNWYYFDDDMRPQLTTKEAIEAAELYVENVKNMAPNQPELTGLSAVQSFGEGKAVFGISSPSAARIFEDPKAVSRGKWDTYPIPGYVIDGPDGKKILNRRSVNLASWSVCVNNHSKKRDLAVCLAAFFADPDMLVEAMIAPGTWHDPCRYNAVGPNAPARLKDVRGPVLTAFEENATIMAPMLSGIRGATEYNVTLSKNLHAAMTGSIDTVKALETTEQQWEEATERLGREKQIEAWREIKKYYPTTTL